MKEFKKQKLKEFKEQRINEFMNLKFTESEGKFIAKLIDDTYHEGYKDGFMRGNEAMEETFNKLNKNTYNKAIEDAVKICDEKFYHIKDHWDKYNCTSLLDITTYIKKKLQQLKVKNES